VAVEGLVAVGDRETQRTLQVVEVSPPIGVSARTLTAL